MHSSIYLKQNVWGVFLTNFQNGWVVFSYRRQRAAGDNREWSATYPFISLCVFCKLIPVVSTSESLNRWNEEWAFVATVKMLLCTPAFHIQVRGLQSQHCFLVQLLANAQPESRKWWPKSLGPCHPCGRPKFSSRLLVSAWPSLSCYPWFCSHWREDLYPCLSNK